MTALAVDLLAGEPPAALHPTVWMGRWIAGARRSRRAVSPLVSLGEGALAVGGGIALAALAGRAADVALARAPRGVSVLARGVLLKPALSLRALLDAAMEVRDELRYGTLDAARRALGWHLVSRDTTRLTATEVAGAVIESVAENLSDGVVAPIIANRVGGLAAAYAYRMINTADAMLGYRTPELEWFGKAAARVDDAANLVPARVTAALLCLWAPLGRGSPGRAARVALRDAGRAASPNAGWPMAAMAGALDVELTKRATYVLNPGASRPTAAHIERACRIVLGAAATAALVADAL